MNKFVKNIMLIGILLIFGYCIIDSEHKLGNGIIGTGDDALDQGLLDALDKGVSAIGMTQWESQSIHKIDSMSFKIVDNIFVSPDKKSYKEVIVRTADGVWEAFWNDTIKEYILFEDEVVYKSIQEGTFSIIESFNKLFDEKGREISKEEFYTLYMLDPNVHYIWRSTKTKGLGEWVEFSNKELDPVYYIVKNMGSKFSKIVVIPREISGTIVPGDFITYGGIDNSRSLTYTKR